MDLTLTRTLTEGQVAVTFGVTVRTLHLDDLRRLSTIVVHRRLACLLEEIGELLRGAGCPGGRSPATTARAVRDRLAEMNEQPV